MRLLLFIHLVCVTFWLGGQLMLVAVITPALRGLDPVERHELFRKVGRMYGKVSGPVLLVILATGIWMAAKLDLDPSDSSALRNKLIAVGVVLVGTVLHGVAASRGARRLSRAGSILTLAATLAAVWFATGL